MKVRVRSAARASYPLHGKSNVEAWKEELTSMFDPNAINPKSFILQHYRLECIRRRKPDDISLGDVFKYISRRGNETCVKIIECTPHQSYAYDVGQMPVGERFIDEDFEASNRMEFFLRNYRGGTWVEIRRRNKGFVDQFVGGESFIRYIVTKIWDAVDARFSSECRTNPAQAAAEDLQLILTGKCVKGDEIRHGDIIIKRDDSYRITF